ncbi:MAG TPA: purine-nucleoside phosphorylase [Tissierellia bacterium]|nr:purine-nucleoside phosphorylase [Tissierellia bacterium]
MDRKFDYEYFRKSADYILDKIDFKPEIAIILGSSLGPLAEEIKNPVVIDYKDIPNFLISTVKSHAGKLILGELNGKKIACMSGRFHFYEGYDFEELVIPVRVLHLLGVKTIILTNAAGAVNTSYKPGDIMIIKDHIKLMGASPLRGPNIEEFGERFFDVSDMYTKSLRELAKRCADRIGINLQEGVYFFCPGPQFETPAEIRAIRILGGDAVGMSTVTEALTAAHCGMKVLGLSLITNMAAGILNKPVTSEEVDETGAKASEKFRRLIGEIVKEIN